MLQMAHQAYGRLPWADLFAEAIRLARDGFGVSPRLSALLARRGPDHFSPNAKELYFDDDGKARPLGYVIKNPTYADTLALIAEKGPSAFYSGPVAEDILGALAASPGTPTTMTAADLADYRAIARPPVCLPYRDENICGMGPPSSGGLTVAQTLGLLDHFDLGKSPSAAAAHLVIEAENLAFADRNRYLADPAFADIPDGLLDPGYLRSRAALINPLHAGGRRTAGTPPSAGRRTPGEDATIEAPGTTHISVVDAKGNAVALTSSIETAFGTGIMAGGFLLNNQLTDFAFRPADDAGQPLANRPEGTKRPRSSMAPTMVLGADGGLSAVLGSPGGSRIIPYVVQALIALIDWNMEPSQAVALGHFAGRNHGLAEVEAGAANDGLAGGLALLGHKVARPAMTSGLHVIAKGNGVLRGGADPRREGTALGR
jgi:gamma-glutamyltranspeptidase/glutathione hydrolase